ncbi:MAG: hypothetical protein R3E50_02040 [Halioglobus sp.]
MSGVTSTTPSGRREARGVLRPVNANTGLRRDHAALADDGLADHAVPADIDLRENTESSMWE